MDTDSQNACPFSLVTRLPPPSMRRRTARGHCASSPLSRQKTQAPAESAQANNKRRRRTRSSDLQEPRPPTSSARGIRCPVLELRPSAGFRKAGRPTESRRSASRPLPPFLACRPIPEAAVASRAFGRCARALGQGRPQPPARVKLQPSFAYPNSDRSQAFELGLPGRFPLAIIQL